MAMLIDQIDSSGLFAQSAYSASIATKDSNGNDITATYLTAHQDISNKLDTTAFSDVSGSFYPYSNPSGFITGVDLTPYQTISGMTAYQTTAEMSEYQTTSNMTAYEPKISYGYSAGAVSSINGSAILGETIPYEVYGISAGDNITIWEDNNALWISASVEGSTYTGDVQGALDEVYTNSSVWLTAHQDISNKLDVTAFSEVSASFLTAVPAGYATENWVTSQGYITGVDLTPYLTTATYATDSGTFATTTMLNDYQTTADMTYYYTKTDTSSKQELSDAIGNVETLLASL